MPIFSLAKLTKGKKDIVEKYITHPLNVAILLATMESDEETILAGLLHDVIEEKTSVDTYIIKLNFSASLADLVEKITTFRKLIKEGRKIDTCDDKVVLVCLADRLHNMRTIQFTSPERFKERAKETLEIFSPFAAKLKKIQRKSELDNLAFKYL